MRLAGTTLPVNGISGTFKTTFSFHPIDADRPVVDDVAPLATDGNDLFGRLVSLYQGYNALAAELKSVKRNLVSAKTYAATPGCNVRLAEARLLQLRAKHSAALTRIRANRVESRALLARLDLGSAAVPA